MTRHLQADGDRWQIAVDRHDPHPGTRAVVFHCLSNPQRPYRVAEVPSAALPSAEAIEHLTEGELMQLFDGSDPLDYTHGYRSAPGHIGVPVSPPGRFADYRPRGSTGV